MCIIRRRPRRLFSLYLPLGLLSLAILAGLLLTSHLLVTQAVNDFEQRELYAHSAKFASMLDRELSSLSTLAGLHAERLADRHRVLSGDPILGHENGYEDYLAALFTPELLTRTQVDLVLVLDRAGGHLWCNLEESEAVDKAHSVYLTDFGPLGEAVLDRADQAFFPRRSADPVQLQVQNAYQQGYLTGPRNLISFSLWPVCGSDPLAEPLAYLVFARRMDASRVSAYLGDPKVQAYFSRMPPAGYSQFPVRALVLPDELLHFTVVSDVRGLAIGAWAVSVQRSLRHEGWRLFLVFTWICLGWFGIGYLGMVLLVQRRMVRPLTRLSSQVDAFLPKTHSLPELPASSEWAIHGIIQRTQALMVRVQGQSQELDHLAGNDGLTGLANRRKLQDYVDAEVLRIRRRGYETDGTVITTRQAWMAFIMMDIDLFKDYNQAYGHPAGDHCMRVIAEVLNAVIKRPQDLPCRLGGDSFGMVLPETNEKGGVVIAKRVAELLERRAMPHPASRLSPFVTASFGVAALMVDEHFNLELLMSMADRALLAAKDEGRNRLCTSDMLSRKPSSGLT